MENFLQEDFGINCCPECLSTDVFYDHSHGAIVCRSCGLILNQSTFDQGAEWRAFNKKDIDKRARTGAPASLCIHDKGLSTIIDWRDKDAFGNKLSPKLRAQAYRLRKWQVRMQINTSLDRNLAYAMSELDRLCSQLSLSRIYKEAAAKIYRKSVKLHLIRGRSIDSMIAASIYIACRQFHYPCKLEEISNKSRLSTRDIGKSYRLILRKLNLNMPTPTGNRFISRFAQDLNVSQQAQMKAIRILNSARRFGLTSGKDPCGLAAASIYVAALKNGERKTQKEIAKVANITEVTVRNRYKEIVRRLKIKINP